MNIVFWAAIILLFVAIWLIMTTSVFSREVGGFIKDIHEVVKENMEDDGEEYDKR